MLKYCRGACSQCSAVSFPIQVQGGLISFLVSYILNKSTWLQVTRCSFGTDAPGVRTGYLGVFLQLGEAPQWWPAAAPCGQVLCIWALCTSEALDSDVAGTSC